MGRTSLRKVLGDLRLHKSRTLIVVLAMAVGLVAAGSVLVKYAFVRTAIDRGFRASNPPSAFLTVDRVSDELLAAVRSDPGVLQADARRTLDGAIWIDGQPQRLHLFVADDLATSPVARLAAVSGAWPPPDGTIVLENSSLQLIGRSASDFADSSSPPSFDLQLNGERQSVPVAGVARDVGLAPGWMERVVYAFANRTTLAALGESPHLDEIRLVVSDPTADQQDIRRLAAGVTRSIERAGGRVIDVSVPRPGEHIHERQMDSSLFVQGAIGVLALCLAAILVVNFTTATLVGQIREIGVMKALGGSTARIAGLYLILIGVLGAVACALSVPIALAVGRHQAVFTTSVLNFELAGTPTPLWVVLVLLAVGLGLPLVAAALPVARGARISVAEALRYEGVSEDAGVRPPGPLARRLGTLSRPLQMALRNTFRKRGRLALTLLTLAAGGAIFMATLNLRTSILLNTERIFSTREHDAVITLPRATDRAQVEDVLRRIPGLEHVESWEVASAARVDDEGLRTNTFRLIGPPPGARFANYAVIEGQPVAEAAGVAGAELPLVVNTQWVAEVHPVRVGDAVRLAVRGEEHLFRVVGIVDSSPTTPMTYTSAAVLGALTGEPGKVRTTLLSVDSSDFSLALNVGLVRQRDAGRAGGAGSSHGRSLAERVHGTGTRSPHEVGGTSRKQPPSEVAGTSHQRHVSDPHKLAGSLPEGFDEPQAVLAGLPRLVEVVLEQHGVPGAKALGVQNERRIVENHVVLAVDVLGAMALLLIAVGGFSLAMTMSLAVLERTREIGVLKAIGASHRSILVIVLVEGLVISVLGWLVALPASVPASWLLGDAFGRIMFNTPIAFTAAPAAAALWLGIAVVLAGVASLYPTYRALRVPAADALARP